MSRLRTFLSRSSKFLEPWAVDGHTDAFNVARGFASLRLPAQQGLRQGLRASLSGSGNPSAASAAHRAIALHHTFAPAFFSRGTRQAHSFASQTLLRYARQLATKATKPAHPLGLAGSRLAVRSATTVATAGEISTGAAALTAGLTSSQRHALAWWLGGCSAWVFSMVVLGGVTRLTRSGLSMTDWKFTGETPPQTQEEWEIEFSRYQQSPEYRRVNISMDVEGFKFIYWMEWAHRAWGRSLGLAFAIPAAWFAVRGAITRPLARRLGLLFLMGGSQGLVGWWMVRSGLEEPEDLSIPRVSPYRLAAHLTSAFAIYATMVWTTLSVAVPNPPAVVAGPPAARAAAVLRALALPVAALIGVTAVSGAFVAGLDAGHAYNTFPQMNEEWIPGEYWSVTGWRNAFESTAAVQLHHRVLALSTLTAVALLWRRGTALSELPPASRALLHGLAGAAAAQVGLGIATLLNCVPVSLGAAHQAGALTLFTVVLGLLYSVRPAPSLAPFRLLASKYATGAAALAVAGVGGVVAQST